MEQNTDYQRRINSVVNHVAASLNRAHTVDELAAVANLSKFHFHRIFRVITGETVSNMVTRLRLESAAATLIYKKHISITQIALDHGYSSGANFTKAFTRYFGSPPSDYRVHSSREPHLSKIGKANTPELGGQYSSTRAVQIVHQPELELAYLRQTGAYDHQTIIRMHDEVRDWVAENNCGHEEKTSIGVTWSDSHIASEERWRYDVALSKQYTGTQMNKIVEKSAEILGVTISHIGGYSRVKYPNSIHWHFKENLKEIGCLDATFWEEGNESTN